MEEGAIINFMGKSQAQDREMRARGRMGVSWGRGGEEGWERGEKYRGEERDMKRDRRLKKGGRWNGEEERREGRREGKKGGRKGRKTVEAGRGEDGGKNLNSRVTGESFSAVVRKLVAKSDYTLTFHFMWEKLRTDVPASTRPGLENKSEKSDDHTTKPGAAWWMGCPPHWMHSGLVWWATHPAVCF